VATYSIRIALINGCKGKVNVLIVKPIKLELLMSRIEMEMLFKIYLIVIMPLMKRMMMKIMKKEML